MILLRVTLKCNDCDATQDLSVDWDELMFDLNKRKVQIPMICLRSVGWGYDVYGGFGDDDEVRHYCPKCKSDRSL